MPLVADRVKETTTTTGTGDITLAGASLNDISHMSGHGSGLTTAEWQAYRAANTALAAVFGL